MASTALRADWWTGEDAIRLSCLPRYVPVNADGRPVTRQTVYVWATAGLHGIKLRRFRCGGQWCTTKQEVARWQAALTVVG